MKLYFRELGYFKTFLKDTYIHLSEMLEKNSELMCVFVVTLVIVISDTYNNKPVDTETTCSLFPWHPPDIHDH